MKLVRGENSSYYCCIYINNGGIKAVLVVYVKDILAVFVTSSLPLRVAQHETLVASGLVIPIGQ